MAIGGLRAKSLLGLLLVCVVALLPAVLVGWQGLESIYRYMGQAYARSITLLDREKILGPVLREYALSARFAQDEQVRRFLQAEHQPELRRGFFKSAELWREAFRDKTYFVASRATGNYYFNSSRDSYSEQPRHVLQPQVEDHQWFFNTLAAMQGTRFNINVDVNSTLNTTKVWLNWVVTDETERPIGVVGTGIDLSEFIRDFVLASEPGVLSMIVGLDQRIQVHPDRSKIALNSGTGGGSQGQSLFDLLDAQSHVAVREALDHAVRHAGQAQLRFVRIQQCEQLLALVYIPELKWHVINLVDLSQAKVLEGDWQALLLIAAAVLPLLLLIGFAWAVERLVLRPIDQLKRHAQAIASGQYELQLDSDRRDEIGELSMAFGVMAEKVRRHTMELEDRVLQRTEDLAQANREMAAAHQKISDSINYAGLIQGALLPPREQLSTPGLQHALLWRPRDVVGGDLYIIRRSECGYLLGIVDCAGHGVPGALMTMLAHAAINQAISEVGLDDPAALLAHTDANVRDMLQTGSADALGLATHMDMGLAYADLQRRELVFAGAKSDLYFSDGQTVGCLAGARRAVGERRPASYQNICLPWSPKLTLYLTSDGVLDQAGGPEGYGFGRTRFTEMILQNSRKDLPEQIQAFSDTIASYQGDRPQRDDITVLCVRLDPDTW
jgi:sigma-B regulation protein RsbU (phosphoserine phosphatase)